jgi:hypothetical protein
MTPVPIQPKPETFAEGLMQSLDAVRGLAEMVSDLGEQTTVRSRFTVLVHSEAEVDAAAAEWGITPERVSSGHYRAVRRMGPVTVLVAFIEYGSAPADTATLAGVCNWAAGEVHEATA